MYMYLQYGRRVVLPIDIFSYRHSHMTLREYFYIDIRKQITKHSAANYRMSEENIFKYYFQPLNYILIICNDLTQNIFSNTNNKNTAAPRNIVILKSRSFLYR